MKLSKLWLREWVDFTLTEKQLADQLTMAGLEIDAVSPVAGEFTHVVVAEILSTKPHPDADKLTLCEVNANTEKPLKIVCGASNVRPGLKVALAMIGAELPGDFKIKESKLRGELSQGMLCSVSELGLDDESDGIMELEVDAPVGMDLRTYLQLDDHVFDVDLTPNRADCFSVLGIAREVAALNQLPLIDHPVPKVPPAIDEVRGINLKNPQGCPQYVGRIIRGINEKATTPLWMSERLRRSGIRTRHLVVDITNYVMIELGQPMHAYDLSQIIGEITVRLGNEFEQLTLLDGQEVTLNTKTLVIADEEKALALAGVMGGASSAVQEQTSDIFLESAFFNPLMIAGVARRYGLVSDASQRFERGVDPHLQSIALARSTALILSLAGGQAGPLIEACDKAHSPSEVAFSLDTAKVERLTGLSLSVESMIGILESLGFMITRQDNQVLQVKVPSHRFDIQLDVDLVEEIIRLYGYDNLKAQPMIAPIRTGNASLKEQRITQLSSWFVARGYHETISYSFVDPEVQEALYPDQEVMELLNPISTELSQMRVGMWPGLIASMIYNVHRQQSAIRFFEVGVVFDVKQQQLTERACIAGLLTGKQGHLSWIEPERAFDFYDMKGDLQSLFSVLKLTSVEFVSAPHPALHPGQSAQIVIHGEPAGWIGVLHPRLSDALDLTQDVLLFEINLEALLKPITPRYQSISKYPLIRRDLSFFVDKQVGAMQIENCVKQAITDNWLKAFDVFDVYMGTGVPEGKKSMGIAMTLQNDERTLVDAEINLLIAAILRSLENEFSITLRE